MRTSTNVVWAMSGMLLFLAAIAPVAWAQTPSGASGKVYAPFVTADPGVGSVPVSGLWRFHTGDDPTWAQPRFDDSRWELQRGDDTWGNQGHPGYWGWAWYRKEIDILHAGRDLGLLMPPIDDAYEIYWNGRRIGQFWQVPPHARVPGSAYSEAFALPADETGNVRGVLAVRVWKTIVPMNFGDGLGGFEGTVRLGNLPLLEQGATQQMAGWERDSLLIDMMAAAMLALGLVALMLYLAEGREALYLWFAFYLLFTGVRALDTLSFLSMLPLGWYQLYYFVGNIGERVFLWLLLLCLFGLWKQKEWRRWAAIVITLDVAVTAVDIAVNFLWAEAGQGFRWTDGIADVVQAITPLFAIVIVTVGLRRTRNLALVPLSAVTVLLAVFHLFWENEPVILQYTHWTWFDRMLDHLRFHIGPYIVCTPCHQDILLVLVLLVTMAQYAVRERRRKAQVELEMKSAAEVQQVLIPEAVPVLPGYGVNSLYRPATQVGGDFFQVMAHGDGTALVVLGDVSGKGLKAAMTVSLIVGILRTLVDFTTSPGEILEGLNRRLMGRLSGGFATCLVVRLESDGAVTIGNAGHLPPFLAGREVALEGSLPLGLVREPAFEELRLEMREGETLTLYTDGIVEARNPKGELYGFARTQKLVGSGASAEAIAAEACAFGQEDDITVLSIRRLAAQLPVRESPPLGQPVTV